jgi:hypothetical protein
MIRREVRDMTVYMEIFSEKKVAYRVLSVRMNFFGEEIITYGIEIFDHKSRQREFIADFSRNIEDAIAFAESLINERSSPKQLYSRALNYLSICI